MFSKVYTITCNPGQSEALLATYDASIVPAVTASEHHVGHHMVEVGDDKWVLVSNYVSQEGAEASASMVQELVKPMVEGQGMTLEVIGQGEVVRTI